MGPLSYVRSVVDPKRRYAALTCITKHPFFWDHQIFISGLRLVRSNLLNAYVMMETAGCRNVVCISVSQTMDSAQRSTGMHRITTFRSTTDRIYVYDGGPIRL